VDPTYAPSGQESINSSPAQVDRNVRFADLTSEILRTKLGILVTVDTSIPRGHIRLTATESPQGPPRYIDIAVFDPDGELLIRKRIWNDTQALLGTWSDSQQDRYRYNERLAAYIAEKVADLLIGKQTDNQD
jgi:hypothetical protein